MDAGVGEPTGMLQWVIGGLAVLFSGGYLHVQYQKGKQDSEAMKRESDIRQSLSEVWRRIDQINDDRVRREDVKALQNSFDSLTDEIRVMRAGMVDMAQSVGYLKGKLESSSNGKNGI